MYISKRFSSPPDKGISTYFLHALLFCARTGIFGAKYSKMDQVKVVEDSLKKLEVIWSTFHKYYFVHS